MHDRTACESSSGPLNTLLLSLSFAQKIHHLILVSRQIQGLARGWFSGSIQEADAERRMSELEERYDALRQEVECELESAWVNAGYLPIDIPTFPASRKTPGSASIKPAVPTQGLLCPTNANPGYTVDTALKRKSEEDEYKAQYGNKKRKQSSGYDYSSEEDAVSCALPIQPIGVTQAMKPLKHWERDALKKYEFSTAVRGRKGARMQKVLWNECTSPKGTFTRFW